MYVLGTSGEGLRGLVDDRRPTRDPAQDADWSRGSCRAHEPLTESGTGKQQGPARRARRLHPASMPGGPGAPTETLCMSSRGRRCPGVE